MTHTPPRNLCLLRLSALGDAIHTLAVLRQLQGRLPQCALTWVIGPLERRLLGDVDGVEFIVHDKRRGLAGWRELRGTLAERRFDVLLVMQLALRAGMLSAAIRADRRIGFDQGRSKELHGLFINERIGHQRDQHVQDALLGFLGPLGLAAEKPEWQLPIPDDACEFARQHLPGSQPTLLISPCSSHRLRNWHARGYAAVADHAMARGFRVALCGGRSALERQTGDAIIAAMQGTPIDLIARDTLPQLLALLQRADVVLCPDSGPMHMANAVGTKVIGLHAATASWRSGPYSDRRYCIDHYEAAARRFLGKPASALPWGKRVEFDGVMDLIGVDEVCAAFDRYVADSLPGAAPPLR